MIVIHGGVLTLRRIGRLFGEKIGNVGLIVSWR